MSTIPDLLTELQTALERLTLALTTGRPDAVLAAEGPVADALQKLKSIDPRLLTESRNEIAPRVLAVRQAIGSARRLGAASARIQAAMLPAPYSDGRRPVEREAQPRVVTIDSRV